jgi:UDPglucose 6-dehydrogenase
MSARITVIGAGYVGLITAAGLAKLGHSITCLEIDTGRLRILEGGGLPIYEPGLGELVSSQRQAGRLAFTDDYSKAIPRSEFAFLTVNTPSRSDGRADLSCVFAAVRSFSRLANPGTTLIIKSTVPVGTADEIEQLIRESDVPNIEVVSNPEFLREGLAIGDFLEPDRIVIGAQSRDAAIRVAHLYDTIEAPVLICRRRTAELGKYVANALLATRISFMNDIAHVCNAAKADIQEVEKIVGSDHRIGPHFLKAGLGWGGSCFPKDLDALAGTATSLGLRLPVVEAAIETNKRQQLWAYEQLMQAKDGAEGFVVGVLGLAFKPDTDDIRNAPAIHLIRRMLDQNVEVRAHDPVAMDHARRLLAGVRYCPDPYEATLGCDALLLATEWSQYSDLDWRRIHTLMRGSVVLDGRNTLNPCHLRSLGFRYLSFGRPVTDDLSP